MSPEEAKQFLTAARTLAEEQERGGRQDLIPQRCWSALWHLLLGAGLRPGEAFALKWKDVTGAGGTEHAKAVKVHVPAIS